MKKIYYVLLLVVLLGLIACKQPVNQISYTSPVVPEKYQGKWYGVYVYDAGETVCEILPDKIIFFRFPIHTLSLSETALFIGKYFDITVIDRAVMFGSSEIAFDISSVTNNDKNVIGIGFVENYLVIELYVWMTIDGKEIPLKRGYFYLDRGER